MKLLQPILSVLFMASHSTSLVFTHKAPIVFATECDRLTSHLGEASCGRRFLLATDFGNNMDAVDVRDNLRYMMQLSLFMTYMLNKPIIQLDMGLTRQLSVEDGISDSHNRVVGSLNLVRSFLQGGMGSISHYEEWNVVKNRWHTQHFLPHIGKCIRFMTACGYDDKRTIDDYYVGHDANVVSYEQQMTRNDSISGCSYACSSHFLSVDLHLLHLVQGVENPIGVVVYDDTPTDGLLEAIQTINPENKHGKITLVIKMRNTRHYLPRLVEDVQKRGLNVLWCCDLSVCRFYDFVRIHRDKKTIVGGVMINHKDMGQVQSIVKCLMADIVSGPANTDWNRFSL